MWPTSLWNLGVLLLVLSALLIGDWEFAKPVTSRLDNLEDILHIPRCKFIHPVYSSGPSSSADNLCKQFEPSRDQIQDFYLLAKNTK